MSTRHTQPAPRVLGSRSTAVVFVALVIAVATGFGAMQVAARAPISQEPDVDVNASGIVEHDVGHRLFAELFRGAGDGSIVQALLAGTTVHTPTSDSVGPEGVAAYMDRLRSFFPDGEFVVTNVMSSGIIVVVQWAIIVYPDGTYNGPALGDEPTRMPGTAVMRLGDDAIAEMWIQLDPPEVPSGDQAA